MARDDDERPFFLTVSFMQPHDPYMTPRTYWDRYDHDRIDLPAVPELADDAHSRRLYRTCSMDEYRITDAHVRNARHAYYGMISYLDDQLARLRGAVEAAGLGDDTLWILTSDHGEMLGEHGLWYKMHFFEHAVRVPLVFNGPGISPGRIEGNVSLVDLLPTLVDYGSDGAPPALAVPVDGRSLLPDLGGDSGDGEAAVVSEYLAEGAVALMLMLKKGKLKYVCSPGDSPRLYDVASDPGEQMDLAGRPELAAEEFEFRTLAGEHWDAEVVRDAVMASQRRRRVTHAALQVGAVHPWDFQPYRDASRQYNRNVGGEMYDTDRRARIPYRDPPVTDGGDERK